MPAFSSSSPPSCQPSFAGKRLLVLSPSNANATATGNPDELPYPVFGVGSAGGIVDPLTENLYIPSTDYLFHSPSLRKKRNPLVQINNDRCHRLRSLPKPDMDASFPGHLRPSNHPILNDLLKSGESPPLQSFQEEPEIETPTNSKVPVATPAQPEKRRAKRYGQQGGRYRTTPITLEEIREIDEELYAKQHPPKKDEQVDAPTSNGNGPTGKRTSLHSFCSDTLGPRKHFAANNGATDFRCTFMTKTQLLPGRTFWPSHMSMKERHRSQESLAHLGHSPLPTIPEEWRQQQQQQKATIGGAATRSQAASVAVTVQAPASTSKSDQTQPPVQETCQPLKQEVEQTNDNRAVHVG